MPLKILEALRKTVFTMSQSLTWWLQPYDAFFIYRNKKKHIIFVAFAEDEKEIMSLSQDGVVLIHNLDLPKTNYSEGNNVD